MTRTCILNLTYIFLDTLIKESFCDVYCYILKGQIWAYHLYQGCYKIEIFDDILQKFFMNMFTTLKVEHC